MNAPQNIVYTTVPSIYDTLTPKELTEFGNFVRNQVFDDIEVYRALSQYGKIRIPLETNMEPLIRKALIGSGWWFDTENFSHVSNDGCVSFKITTDARTNTLVLRIEILKMPRLKTGKSEIEIQHILQTENPILGLYEAVISSKLGILLQAYELTETVQERVSEKLTTLEVPLSINPRDFTPEAYVLYVNSTIPKPEYTVTAGGQTFFLTQAFEGDRKPILGYVKLAGKYHIRYFYKSLSGGNWHSAPGMDGNVISKGEFFVTNNTTLSYEKGTAVVDELASKLEIIPVYGPFPTIQGLDSGYASQPIMQTWNHACTPLAFQEISQNVIDDFKLDAIKIQPLLSNVQVFGEIFGNGILHSQKPHATPEEVIRFFESIPLPEGLVESLKYKRRLSDKTHEILGVCTERYECSAVLGGKNITVVFTRGMDMSNHWWIDDIYFQDATVSSWGFLREQINAGILTCKPTEYGSQCPSTIDAYSNPQGVGRKVKGSYIDIRPYIQGNPLIVRFKKDATFR